VREGRGTDQIREESVFKTESMDCGPAPRYLEAQIRPTLATEYPKKVSAIPGFPSNQNEIATPQ
jgi:hypothetical protein